MLVDYELERQLHEAIQGAVLASGTSKEFAHTLAAKADFDVADVVEILMGALLIVFVLRWGSLLHGSAVIFDPADPTLAPLDAP